VKLSGVPMVWRGTAEPEAVCLTDGQILAIGALMADYGQGLENYCTATLVSEDVVVTAAHCLLDRWGDPINPADVSFAVGDDVASADEIFAVSEVHPHTGYDGEAGHDVGVVVLSESAVAVLPQIEPLPVNRRDLTLRFVGELVQNVGYGQTHDNPRNTRRWGTAEPVTEVLGLECEVYGNGFSSVCHGDSGGPSLYGFDDKAVKVVGTVSWGDTTCVDYDHFCRMDGNTSFLDPFLAGFDECLGLDLTGVCEGNTARWCENGELKQECCAGNCELDNEGRHRCDDTPTDCGTIDRLGECRGDELVWCDLGTLRRRFCRICGQGRCAWVDDTIGYNCVSD
jgi:V8-like Glu-specific endopeptidase